MQMRFLKQECQRMQNEARISALSNRKYLCKIQDLEGQVKKWSGRPSVWDDLGWFSD